MKALSTFLGRFSVFVLLSFSLIGCSQENDRKVQNEIEEDVSFVTETVLFIGNSHTYYNQGIAAHLTKFRENDDLGFAPFIQEVAQGGYSLQDHLGDQTTLDKINERSWTAIVLQENTAVAAEALPSSVAAIQSFSDMVKPNNTKVYLFMTWPYKGQAEMLAGIRQTYQNAVLETGAKLVPVGLEWQAIDENANVDVTLYDPDGIHPSLEGTFYAAAMFYKAIFGSPPSDNAYDAGLGKAIADFLKTEAD